MYLGLKIATLVEGYALIKLRRLSLAVTIVTYTYIK